MGTVRTQTKGAPYYDAGFKWGQFAELSYKRRSADGLVVLPGAGLDHIGASQSVCVLRTLIEMGFSLTRLDAYVDWHMCPTDVLEEAHRSCLREELTGARAFDVIHKESNGDGLTGRSIYLGSKKSPVYAIIYDKGLEQAAAPKGEWVRVETRWKKDRADSVARCVLDAGEVWRAVLGSRVLGAFDFRENNGRSERARRPRVTWWDELVHDLNPTATPPRPSFPDFEKWRRGFNTSYGYTIISQAARLGISPGELVTTLLADVEPGTELGKWDSAFNEFAAHSGLL